MTALPIVYGGQTPRGKMDVNALINMVIQNTGFQATWLKNPDGTQGEQWQLSSCGRGCCISPGCDLCLHRVVMAQAKAKGEKVPPVQPLWDNLQHPFRWQKKKNVFVCPQGDLFHKNIPDDFILEVLEVIRQCPEHNFVATTKRAERLELLKKMELPNLFIGVSVESHEYLWRAEHLLDLHGVNKVLFACPFVLPMQVRPRVMSVLDWVICSPERGGKGRKPRPCPKEWMMDIRDQVKEYGLPFFLDIKHREELVYDDLIYTEVPAQLLQQ
jgi:protein gp37